MSLSRSGLVLTALSAASVLVLGPDAGSLATDVTGPSFPDALLAVGSLVHLVLSGWMLLAVALTLLGGSSRLARAVTPRLMRRALFVGAAGALTLGTAAHAEEVVAPSVRTEHIVSGLQLPDRPTAPAGATAARASSSTPPSGAVQRAAVPTEGAGRPAHGRVVVVRAGDTLWAIAARSLPAGATEAEIARATARWHAANRAVIGADPDLIVPLQRLAPPTAKDRP